MRRFALQLAAFLFLLAGTAHADVRLELATVHPPASDASVNTILVQADKVRMAIVGAEDLSPDGELLFRPDHGQRGRLYLVGTAGEMLRLDSGAGPTLNVPESATSGLSRDQRAAIEAALRRASRPSRASTRPPPEIVPTALTTTLPIGVEATAYEVKRNGVARWRVWTADVHDIANGAEILSAFRRVAAFLSEPGVPARVRDNLFLFDVDAFGGRVPVGYDALTADGRVTEEGRLSAIACASIDPATFEPTTPSGELGSGSVDPASCRVQ